MRESTMPDRGATAAQQVTVICGTRDLHDRMRAMRRALIILLAAPALAACVVTLPGSAPIEQPSGAMLFQDDFSSPASGWNRTKYEQGMMDYDSGSYRILVNAAQANLWSTPHRDFGNVRLEVDAGKLAGPDANRIGLICRSDGTSYYFFIIGSDGYFGLGIFKDGKAGLLGQAAMESSAAIHTGTAVNHLRLDCTGNALAAYVNGVQVASVTDPSLTHGEAGLLAGAFDQPGVDIVFDNFVVLQP